MSLLEMMLEDQRIMLALAAALAPLALAAVLGVAVHVRRLVRARAARRAEEAALALAALRMAGEREPQGDEPAPAADTVESEESPDEDDEAAPDESVSAMQALLDSVFTDEDPENPLAHLLDELEDIQAADLAALAERVAGQLAHTKAQAQ